MIKLVYLLVAARSAERCAERRVTWPWRRCQCNFFCAVSCWQNVKSVKVCLKCPVFNALGRQCAAPNHLPDARPGGALKGALPGLDIGLNANFCVVSCCLSVKICECSLKMRGFHCIGGCSVTPPRVARRWAGRCTERRIAWPW